MQRNATTPAPTLPSGANSITSTIGLEYVPAHRQWRSFGIRSFANTPIPATMTGLDAEVAQRYTDLYRLLHQETPSEYNHKVEQQLKARALEREDEDDEEYEDEFEDEFEEEVEEKPIGNECPICGASLSAEGCNHMVAIYDVTFGVLENGALYGAYREIHKAVETGIRHAIKHDDWPFGVNSDIYEIPSKVPSGATEEDIFFVIANHYGEIKSMIYDRLENYCADVTVTEWEFDANRPGGCSWYKGYWSEDPDAVVAWLKSEFCVRTGALLVDPMLPAVLANEQKIQCGRDA
jgi:hypothetical protein